MRHWGGRRGNTIIETAMLMPVLLLLLVGMAQIARITYTYYTLRKTVYAIATYLSTQQAVNFCAPGDPTITAAINFGLTGTTESLWASATPQACGAATPNASVEDAMCGLSSRMTDPTQITACTNVSDVTDLAAAYTPDPDTLSETDYTTYVGNNRRVLTLPVVNALSTTPATMQVVGFRQFLMEPTTTSTASPQANVPSDVDGRFVAMYLGSVAPVKQGNLSEVGMNISCGISTGPGKVVLFQ